MSNSTLDTEIDAWLTMNSTNFREAISGPDPRSLMALLGTLSQGEAVVSGAQLISQKRQEILDGSRKIASNRNTDEGLEAFRNSPVDGCTTVMTMARVAAGFKPLSPDTKHNVAAFHSYIDRLQSAPFFHVQLSDVTELRQKTSDWNELIDKVSSLFDGVTKEDFKMIKDSLASLAKVAASHKNTKNTKDLFAQSILRVNESNGLQSCVANICFSHVEMEESESKGSTTRQSRFVIAKAAFEFKSEQWHALAPKVWAKNVSTVDDWLDSNNTPSGDQKHKLCVGNG